MTKFDVGTQTDTHFMESNIVKSYEWNEWELRRKAIKLVRPDIPDSGELSLVNERYFLFLRQISARR